MYTLTKILNQNIVEKFPQPTFPSPTFSSHGKKSVACCTSAYLQYVMAYEEAQPTSGTLSMPQLDPYFVGGI